MNVASESLGEIGLLINTLSIVSEKAKEGEAALNESVDGRKISEFFLNRSLNNSLKEISSRSSGRTKGRVFLTWNSLSRRYSSR